MRNTVAHDTGGFFIIACILLSICGVLFVQALRVRKGIPAVSSIPTATSFSPRVTYPWVTYVPVPVPRPSPLPSATPALFPRIQAQSALVFDLTHYAPLFAHQASLVYPVASITKLMTALVVSESKIPESQVLVVGQEDVAMEYPSKVVVPGDTLRISEAMRLLLIGSDNSTALLLARSVASSSAQFAERMNVRAYSLGMTSTRFVDPIGYVGNVSTALDLSALMGYLLNHNPELLTLSSYPSLTMILGSGKTIAIENTNILADKIPGFIGGKTGYLDEAGGSLVTVFRLRDAAIATVVLGSPDRFGDTTQLIQWYLKQLPAAVQ